jgi:fermentation-respiration switch protein FrsA (DUF1100 family)
VIAALVAALLLGVVAPLALWYRRLHPDRVALDDDPGRHGLAYRPIEFASPLDGTALAGWYLPSPTATGRTIVIAPGIDSNRLQGGITLALAPALLGAGFDVIAFDLRGEGESGAEPITFGAREQWDVLGAVREARFLGARSVGVIGFSLGGDAAILAAARSPEIDAVVAESAFATFTETIGHELERMYLVPRPLATYALLGFHVVSGVDPEGIAPERAISAIAPRPVLLIHGTADETVPPVNGERLLAAAGDTPAELWLVPGAGHAAGYVADPDEYGRRVVAFFDRALP